MTESAHRDKDGADPGDATENGEHAAAGKAAEQAPSRPAVDWTRISEFISALRSGIVNVAMLLSALALIGLTVMELRHRPVVIDPIRLPGALSAMGYSEDVAAHRLADAVEKITDVAPTAKEGVGLLPASLLPNFEPADAGFSLQNVVQFLRQILKLPETRIGGEFICTTPDCAIDALVLRLRIISEQGTRIIEVPPITGAGGAPEMGQYFDLAARELLRELDPYIVAAYLYDIDKDAAEREAERILGPENAHRKWAMNLLGFIAADRKDYDTAIYWYERTAGADEDDAFAFAYTNWGAALLAKAIAAKDEDGVNAAIAKHRRAIQINPDYGFAYLNLAKALAAKGDPDGALANIVLATEKDPDSAHAFIVLGNALYDRDLDQAIAKYRHASEIDPSSPDAFYNWGRALVDRGGADDLVQAGRKFARVVELDPNDIRAYTNWGIALRKLGDLEGAIDKYRRVTEIDPSNMLAHYNWGVALHQRPAPDLDGAVKKFARAAELDASYAEIFFQWGLVLGKKGDLKGAAEQFALATKANPDYATAQLNLGLALRGLALRNQGSIGDAADALERYLVLAPDSGPADQVRAWVEQLRAAASGG